MTIAVTAMNETDLDGRAVRVNIAEERSRDDQPRGNFTPRGNSRGNREQQGGEKGN